MPRLLVHFHLYYEDQLPFFLDRMGNINGCKWDLYVTYSKITYEARDLILSTFPEAHLMEVENVGFDIWPFVKLLQSVDIGRYDYVLKLHTKCNSAKKTKWRGIRIDGSVWRDRLVDALLENRTVFSRLLERLHKDVRAGLFCHRMFLIPADSPFPEDNEALAEEMSNLCISVTDTRFCAGTIFLARMAPFSLIKDAGLTVERFSSPSVSHGSGTLAHVYERIFSYAVKTAGYRLIPVYTYTPHYWERIQMWFHFNLTSFVEGIFSLTRSGPKQVKYLTLFWIRIPLDKGLKK